MGFFDEQKNVEAYLGLANGYDGRDLIGILEKYLDTDKTILELGMGPGKDLDMLTELYRATGSDASQVFIDLYWGKKPSADIEKLDAVTIETNRKFDCIYSNKVLMHLSREDLKKSFERQKEILNKHGLVFHSFWLGDKEEKIDDLLFIHYQEEEVIKAAGPEFELVATERYTEMEDMDSFWVLLTLK